MIPITSKETETIARSMARYAPRATISRVAGLLTAPNLQANTVRIEVLVHLAVAYCSGNIKPGYLEIGRWLNQSLGKTQMAMYEDPVEDVFVTNVITSEGNRRVFEGIWESNDYFLQIVLDTLSNHAVPKKCHDLLKPAYALLRLSDIVAERLGLQRWHIEPSNSKGFVPVAPATHIEDRARAVTFMKSDLQKFGIALEALLPFIFHENDKEKLKVESTGHSSLELRPLVDFGDALILSLPHSVSPAIRRFVLSELRKMGYLRAFGDALAASQARQVENDALWELKGDTVSITPPTPDDGPMPSLQAWLLKYDSNKYIHVVLLQDRLDWLHEQGLSSTLNYPVSVQEGLEKYLIKVTEHCKMLPSFAEGATLLVMGGLGRGFGLGFNDWPNEEWPWSVIRISDLLMLTSEVGQPIKRYLKCIKQKMWAESQDVFFMNLNGDFNFYCYWRRSDFQLIPRELPVDAGSMVAIEHDFVLPVRKELRNLVDRHLIQTTGGQFSEVTRFGRDAYFKSMQERPIYVSHDHLNVGILAGVVETSRGATWLIIEPREGDELVRHILYQMWSGFLGLFDRLITEIEVIFPYIVSSPIEIRLNFHELNVSEEYLATEVITPISEPVVLIKLEQRLVEIKFPSDFLVNFQKHENTGEKLVLSAIAKGLVRLHQVSSTEDDVVEEALIETLLRKVIGDTGMRILHLFHTYYPIEHLLAQQNQKPVFLSSEDFIFAKLGLSKGCVATKTGKVLNAKEECNDFLHKVVAKIWGQLRSILQQCDRASVIQNILEVNEAAIQDRDHWRRTAQAVIALYKPVEDAFAVAGKRESDRSLISLSGRTILEMAICECPASGGKVVCRWDIDEMLAKAALLVEVATDSDAINLDLAKPELRLYANGEYAIDRSFHEAIIRPFLTNYQREEFEGAAGDYSKLYQRELNTERIRAEEIYSADFNNAFVEEFGLTPDDAVDGFAELLDFAVEKNCVVVQATLGVLRNRLTQNRGLSIEACESYLKMSGIFHRPSWDIPPDGFKNKDLEPWRFRRRLSATVRPLLIFGEQDSDTVYFGAGSLRQGFAYLLKRAEAGQLPDRFFVTKAMKKYIGSVNNERGHAFAKTVADKLRQKGWQVRNEVNMSELGTPREDADGDVDVLAWKSSGEVLLIECKRLQLARTVAEIAEICRRFRGEAKDELDKHIRRANWVIQNPSSLQRIVGFIPQPNSIDARLVTNTHVPMMYLNSLPISAEKIGPLA